MSAPDGNPFDVFTRTGATNTPHRPTVEDFDGCQCLNAVSPPDPVTMPTAPAWNTMGRTLAAYARVVPAIVATVRFDSGTPSLEFMSACSESLAVVVVDNGVGDTSLTWTSDTVPPPIADPMASVSDASTDAHIRAYAITNGVRVVTKNLAGAAADVRFTVLVF